MQLFIIILPISFFMIIFNFEIVYVFMYFDDSLNIYVQEIGIILSIYLLSAFFVSINYFFTKVFIVNKDYFNLLLSPLITIFFTISGYFIFEGIMKQYSIPFSFTFANVLTSIIVLYFYRKIFSGRMYFLIKRFALVFIYLLTIFIFKQLLLVNLSNLNYFQILFFSGTYFGLSFSLIALCFKKVFHKNNFDFFFNPSA
jgi:hypothetical protein